MKDNINALSHIIIGKAIEIHRTLGPGLLESFYQECLYYELISEGLHVEKEKTMPLTYKEVRSDKAYRIDLLVENKIVVETKCVEKFNPIHEAQVLTYMRLGNHELGLLINFHTKLLKDGIKRLRNFQDASW